VLGVFAAVGTFKAGELEELESLGILIAGVFAGATTWWLFLSVVAGAVRHRFPARGIVWIGRAAASVLGGLGLVILYFGVTAAVRRYLS